MSAPVSQEWPDLDLRERMLKRDRGVRFEVIELDGIVYRASFKLPEVDKEIRIAERRIAPEALKLPPEDLYIEHRRARREVADLVRAEIGKVRSPAHVTLFKKLEEKRDA